MGYVCACGMTKGKGRRCPTCDTPAEYEEERYV